MDESLVQNLEFVYKVNKQFRNFIIIKDIIPTD